MTLYCVETPWSEYLTPDEYPDCFTWLSSLSEAKAYARKEAGDESWDERSMFPVFSGGKEYRGAVVRKVTLPRLSPKRLALWMSRNATRPSGGVVYFAEYK
jgi:hypothetical protein